MRGVGWICDVHHLQGVVITACYICKIARYEDGDSPSEQSAISPISNSAFMRWEIWVCYIYNLQRVAIDTSYICKITGYEDRGSPSEQSAISSIRNTALV